MIYNKQKSTRGKVHNTKKGVVLLIAVVISSLVLALGIGIGNIIVKEVVLTSLSKNSRVAFFAADAGIECAMHWDLIRNVAIERRIDEGFAITDPEVAAIVAMYPSSVFATDAPSVDAIIAGNFYGSQSMSETKFNPFCGGQLAENMFSETAMQAKFDRSVASAANDPTFITRFFFYPTGVVDDSEPCVLVRIEKTEDPGPPSRFNTSIFSEGFSSCDPDDLRRVSRGLRVDYSI